MSLSAITDEVYTRLSATVGLPPIYFDNVKDDRLPQPPVEDHLMAFILPANTSTLGLSELGQEKGSIKINVRVTEGVGTIIPADIAQLVLDAFPRNLTLTNLRIDDEGSIAPPFYDESWYVTPVTIPYQNLF